MESNTNQHTITGTDTESVEFLSEKKKDSTPRNSYGACESTHNDTTCLLTEPESGIVYKSRFWILGVFSFMSFVHNLVWVTWGPIGESMGEAFPGWDSSTVSLLTNMGTIMYVVWVLPVCWATQRWGLRAGTVTSALLLALGTAIRSITSVTPAFTVLCYVCAVLSGIAGAFIITAPSIVAALWFPAHERTTAMAVMLGSHQLGEVGSYLEPLLVHVPSSSTDIPNTVHEVMTLLYITAGVCAALLMAVVVYYPAKPPSPPSVSSAATRFAITPGLKTLATNKKFLVFLVSYGVFIGPPIAWLTVLPYSLQVLDFHQDTAMWVGLVSVVASSVSPVIAGRLNDLTQGYMKVFLFSLMGLTTVCFYWFLLLSYGAIPVSTWQVYVTVVGAVSFSYAALPLFWEAAIDFTYPVPEILVTGVLAAVDNIFIAVFLLFLNIPNIGYTWMAPTQTFTSFLPILPLVFLKMRSTRADMDT